MKAPVYSKEGKKKGEVVLNPEIYAARVNARLLELVHKAYAANLRHGTADTKTRKEVRGGGKKPWRQKGTGRARHGSIRSPIWKGGGVTFGPHPRDYFVPMPQTMRRKAIISALSLKAQQKNLILLEDVSLQTPKTKEWAEICHALPLQGKRAVCVVKDVDLNLGRASQNLENWVELRRANDLNAFHILQREKLLIEQGALPMLESRLATAAGETKEPAAETAEKKTKKKPARARKSARGSK
jgi:large subunit ribosomal protein L4